MRPRPRPKIEKDDPRPVMAAGLRAAGLAFSTIQILLGLHREDTKRFVNRGIRDLTVGYAKKPPRPPPPKRLILERPAPPREIVRLHEILP